MIIKFHLFEKHEDLDPYGEENWNEDEFNIGDIVICKNVRNMPDYCDDYPILNMKYKVISNPRCMASLTGHIQAVDIMEIETGKELSGAWGIYRFEKIK